jgi:hypothetical protein
MPPDPTDSSKRHKLNEKIDNNGTEITSTRLVVTLMALAIISVPKTDRLFNERFRDVNLGLLKGSSNLFEESVW